MIAHRSIYQTLHLMMRSMKSSVLQGGSENDSLHDAERRAAPGKPEMNVVLNARPGMRDLSFSKRSTVCVRAGRFIPRSTRFDTCCSGMSMYLQTCKVLTRVHSSLAGPCATSGKVP